MIKSILCGALLFSTTAMDSTMPTPPIVNPRSFLSFGFVLLPEQPVSQQISELAESCMHQGQALPQLPSDTPDYVNVSVRVPHTSVGHYGILGMDFPKLQAIVTDNAKLFSPFVEPMQSSISVTKGNVTWYCQNIQKQTNPQIVMLYRRLRFNFMETCHTKTYSLSGLWERSTKHDSRLDMELLNKYYQNWGTPEPYEAPRIRPHFTLVYSHARDVDQLKDAVDATTPPLPQTITFTHLGIVELDAFGNPTREPLFVVPFTKE